jgi:hypothetical protein
LISLGFSALPCAPTRRQDVAEVENVDRDLSFRDRTRGMLWINTREIAEDLAI